VHLSVDHPQRLSRGLVLVKWWLLAVPHYVVVGILGGTWAGTWAGGMRTGTTASWGSGGLIGLLGLVADVILAVTRVLSQRPVRSHPRPTPTTGR